MTVHFKIIEQLLDQVRKDLSRPHPFAFERVGFLFVRPGTGGVPCNPAKPFCCDNPHLSPSGSHLSKWYFRLSSWLGSARREAVEMPGISDRIATESRTHEGSTLMILASSYSPVLDDDYIDDPTVGAKIGSTAIRIAMQRSLDTGMGVLHVHMHEGRGRPWFSTTDMKSMNNLMPSFFNVSPNVPHGALVLNQDSFAGVIWKDKGTSLAISRLSVVGYPCRFSGGMNHD